MSALQLAETVKEFPFQLVLLIALALAALHFITLCLRLRSRRQSPAPDKAVTIARKGFEATVYERRLHDADGAYLITDGRLRGREILYVNPAFSRLTGFQPEDVLGRNGDMLAAEGPLRMESVLWLDAAANGRDVHWIAQLHRHDGVLFWAEANLEPVYDAEGLATHFLVSLNDITDRVQVTAARAPIAASSDRVQSAIR